MFVVAPEAPALPAGVTLVADPRRGQGAAVEAALEVAGASAPRRLPRRERRPALRDRRATCSRSQARSPQAGLALAAAADGTTNALAFTDASLFEPLYGPGSAERFAALAPVAARGRAESDR